MKLSLKNKIFILVILPSLGLIILISSFISRNYTEYKNANNAVEYVKYSNATSKLIHELQKERGKSALFLGGKISKEDLLDQRNNAVKGTTLYMESIPKTEITNNLNTFASETTKNLAEARRIVDNNGVPAEATQFFGKTIQQLILSEIFVAHNANAFGNEKKLLSVTMLDMAKENAGKLRANISNVLNADKELSSQQVGSISSLLAGLNENLSSPTLIITEETKVALSKFKETPAWLKSQATISTVLDNASKGGYNRNSKEFFDSITSAIDDLGRIIFTEQEFVSSLILKKKEDIASNLMLIIFLNGVLLISVVVLSIYFIRSITKPIQNLMEKLNGSSREVNDSSEKVSASSEQLSQNSTQQAAALQEAVTSFEEITQMISKTAENAKVSQNVSRDSFESVHHGQAIVVELNTSINEIAETNEKIKERILISNGELEEISKIISEIGNKTRIINDIVFQTKLLSFNASVEAARAGEQGKGFAVVAEEVGKLAAMSGNAAKEISEVLDKSLILVDKTIENTKREIGLVIDQSKQKVELGSKAAERCGHSLSEIVEKVQEVNKLVIEIAVASNEQSQGMSQISLAMNELDHATHSNSVSSVETAKSGQLLKQQAHELNQAIEDLSKVIYG